MTTTPPPASPPGDDLPLLAEDRVDAIEDQVFARIDSDRAAARSRSSRRTGFWMAGTAAAAVIAVAAIISPSVLASLTPANESGLVIDASSSDVKITEDAVGAPEIAADSAAGRAADAALGSDAAISSIDSAGRDIIASAWASVLVDDVRGAAEEVAQSATSRGGYVESLSLGTGQVSGMPIDALPGSAETTSETAQTGWITVRVPAADLTAVMAELEQIGEVTSSTVDRYDVTDQVVDLEARIEAAQASVDRLLALVAQAESVADLIAAESALAERQATLESYQQQLESLEDQVAMSTLSVTLEVRHDAVDANPAGFWDGLVAGWNGLIATLNGIVVALGFLIPWIAVVAVVGAVVWGVVVLVRRRRRPGTDDSASA